MQVKDMRNPRTQVALRSPRNPHSLAARRAELEARVRQMATDDLEKVGTRLRELREELAQKEGRQWRMQDVVEANNLALRTYAAWEGGENENQGGEGYKKLARFYSRKLGRKITWQWIVFGVEEAPAKAETPDLMGALSPATGRAELEALNARLATISEENAELCRLVEKLLDGHSLLLAGQDGVRDELRVLREGLQKPGQSDSDASNG